MTILDIILLFILAGFVFYGLFYGLIKTVGSLVGVILGAWGAAHFYLSFFDIIKYLFFGLDNLGKVICFLIIFVIINRLATFVFVVLDKTYNILSILPFLKTINRLAGAVFGFIEGGLVLGLALYILVKYVGADNFLGGMLIKSEFTPFLLDFIKILLPLFPEILKEMKTIV
jgi:membrane protein required for colicin V production